MVRLLEKIYTTFDFEGFFPVKRSVDFLGIQVVMAVTYGDREYDPNGQGLKLSEVSQGLWEQMLNVRRGKVKGALRKLKAAVEGSTEKSAEPSEIDKMLRSLAIQVYYEAIDTLYLARFKAGADLDTFVLDRFKFYEKEPAVVISLVNDYYRNMTKKKPILFTDYDLQDTSLAPLTSRQPLPSTSQEIVPPVAARPPATAEETRRDSMSSASTQRQGSYRYPPIYPKLPVQGGSSTASGSSFDMESIQTILKRTDLAPADMVDLISKEANRQQQLPEVGGATSGFPYPPPPFQEPQPEPTLDFIIRRLLHPNSCTHTPCNPGTALWPHSTETPESFPSGGPSFWRTWTPTPV